MAEKSMHDEALRKQRVLDRQKEALQRLDSQGESVKGGSYKMYKPDNRSGGHGFDTDMDEESLQKLRHAIHKDLKQRAKVLRDHNLYMGPMSAFQDIFPPSSNAYPTNNVKK